MPRLAFTSWDPHIVASIFKWSVVKTGPFYARIHFLSIISLPPKSNTPQCLSGLVEYHRTFLTLFHELLGLSAFFCFTSGRYNFIGSTIRPPHHATSSHLRHTIANIGNLVSSTWTQRTQVHSRYNAIQFSISGHKSGTTQDS